MTKPRFVRHLGKVAVAVAVGALLATAPAAAEVSASAAWSCDHWDGGDWGSAGCSRYADTGFQRFWGVWESEGEILDVWDRYPNGAATVVHLTVEGNGTATFKGSGETKTFNLDFPEGLSVGMRVCSSSSSSAVCSAVYGLTT